MGSLRALATYRDEVGRLQHGRKAGTPYFTTKGLCHEIQEELADIENYARERGGWRMAALRGLLRICWWLNGGAAISKSQFPHCDTCNDALMVPIEGGYACCPDCQPVAAYERSQMDGKI